MKRHNFKELLIWQRAMKVVDEIYILTTNFPREEQFGLTHQIRKSAVSIPSNIAEECGRGTDPQLLHFLDVALGSAYELETQIIIANRQRFCNESVVNSIIEKITEVQKMIVGFRQRFE